MLLLFGHMGFEEGGWECGRLSYLNLSAVSISFFLNIVVRNLVGDCDRRKLEIVLRI